MMELPFDILIEICNVVVDSRCLYLTCKHLYIQTDDKIYWTARGDDKIKYWLPKIDTNMILSRFVRHGNFKMVKYLVSVGKDVTEFNNDAIQAACDVGNFEMVKYLVSCGADIAPQVYVK